MFFPPFKSGLLTTYFFNFPLGKSYFSFTYMLEIVVIVLQFLDILFCLIFFSTFDFCVGSFMEIIFKPQYSFLSHNQSTKGIFKDILIFWYSIFDFKHFF